METEKIVVVKKSTLLESLLKRHTTTSQARFYLESAGQSYEFYQQDHKNYHENLKEVVRNIPRTIRTQTIDKDDLSMFKFSNKDLVVAFGDDGLLVNLAKYVGNQPIIFVNADEKRFDGVLATCTTKEFQKALEEKLQDKTYLESLTMAEANLNNGETFYALNDLFIGKKTHVSAKYDIKHNGKEEYQSSSGIVVSTGTGSTGWLTSFATWCKEVCEKEFPYAVPFSRESDSLIFTVREPFPTKSHSSGNFFSKYSISHISF